MGELSPAPTQPSNAKKGSIPFKSNGFLTLGVELELQLVHPQTGKLLSKAEELLHAARHLEKVKREFYQCSLEVVTGICADVQTAEADLRQSLGELRPIAQQMGIAFAATGSHPSAALEEFVVSPGERYSKVVERNQWLARRCTIYGLHVHLGMKDGDSCIRFINFYHHFLPHLLALSASSPFWQGEDTGLASCRPSTFESMPIAGNPYPVHDWQEFEQLCHALETCGSIRSFRDLWWDVRPSPDYGTLEIRVCDGLATLHEALAVTAFIHLLAHWFDEHGAEWENAAPTWLWRENKWRVMRYGLQAEVVMDAHGTTKPLAQDIRDWIQRLQPYSEQRGYQPYLATLQNILTQGNSADRQRRIYNEKGSLAALIQHNIAEFDNS